MIEQFYDQVFPIYVERNKYVKASKHQLTVIVHLILENSKKISLYGGGAFLLRFLRVGGLFATFLRVGGIFVTFFSTCFAMFISMPWVFFGLPPPPPKKISARPHD